MPTLFVFLFKVNIALLLFCAGYYLVLGHLTFYTLNRVYLLTAIIFATLYPKIDLTAFAQRHETIVRPVQNVALVWQAPAEQLATHPNYWQWATYLFWAGAALLAIRFAVQLFSLFKLYRHSKPAQITNHDVRLIAGDAAPFSFWQSIFVNPDNHSPADLKAIILHEQVHVTGWHTIDILLAELSSIFYWFNPGVWLMKRAVRENIEFITDRKILNKGFDSKTYQYSLVNVSFNNTNPGIVNHFNISTIKKRIIMMNAKRSSRFTLTRYVFVIPAVVTLLLVFTLSKAEVARPITLKLTRALQPVSAAIKGVTVSAINDTKTAAMALAKGDTTPKTVINIKPTSARNPVNFKADSVRFTYSASSADTGKKATISIRASGGNDLDSMNFVLDGKKISSREFKNIDPNKISAINIVSQEAMDGLLGPDNNLKFDNNRQVLFIMTNDSETGKELADKLGKRRQVTNIRINGVNRAPGSSNTAGLASATTVTGLKGKVDAINITRTQPLTEVVLDGSPATAKPNEIEIRSVKTNPKLQLKEVRVKGHKADPEVKELFITGYPATGKNTNGDATVSGYGSARSASGTGRVLTLRSAPGITITERTTGNVTTPVNMSDKIYIIDGKEASEKAMKKLSAFDIERIDVSKGADVVEKYGDKAKNGVIFIYTKKNK